MYAYKKWLCLLLIFHFAVQENVIKIHGRSIVEQPTSIEAEIDFLPTYIDKETVYFADHLSTYDLNIVKKSAEVSQQAYRALGTIKPEENRIDEGRLYKVYSHFVQAARRIPEFHATYYQTELSFLDVKLTSPANIDEATKEFLVFITLGPEDFIKLKEENTVDNLKIQKHSYNEWTEYLDIQRGKEMEELLRKKLGLGKAKPKEYADNYDDYGGEDEGKGEGKDGENEIEYEGEDEGKDEGEDDKVKSKGKDEGEDDKVKSKGKDDDAIYKTLLMDRVYNTMLLNPRNRAFNILDYSLPNSFSIEYGYDILKNYKLAENKEGIDNLQILAKERENVINKYYVELTRIFNIKIPQEIRKNYEKQFLKFDVETQEKVLKQLNEANDLKKKLNADLMKELNAEVLPTPSELIGSELTQPSFSATSPLANRLSTALLTVSAFGMVGAALLGSRYYKKKKETIRQKPVYIPMAQATSTI